MIGDLGLTALYESCAERGDMCDGMRDRHPYAHPGARSACRGPCSLPGSLPWRRERPACRVRRFPDPQRILDRGTSDERGSFLEQYQEAVEHARDPAG